MSSSADAWAVIVAAGRARRFGSELKQFALLAGRPMAVWALDPFRAHPRVRGVSLVVPSEHAAQPPKWLAELSRAGVALVAGGEERTDSVRLGLETVPEDIALVAVHDGARPLITPQAVSRVLEAAGRDRGAIAARPVIDSLKQADAGGTVASSVSRVGLWRAETPQVFPRGLILEAHRRAAREGVHESDCAALCERYGCVVTLVEISEPNPKITHPADLELAEAWITRRESRGTGRPC